MRVFYIYYSEQAYGNIMTRFGLSSVSQIDLMYGYLEQMISDFLQFGGDSYEPTALGMLTAKALNSSYAVLQSDFPIDVTTRNLASDFNQNAMSCATFINPVVVDPTTAANICATYSFTNVDQLMPFVAGMWYGGDYLTSLQTATGMT